MALSAPAAEISVSTISATGIAAEPAEPAEPVIATALPAPPPEPTIAPALPAEPIESLPAEPAEPGFVASAEPAEPGGPDPGSASTTLVSSLLGRSTKNQTAAAPAATKNRSRNSTPTFDFDRGSVGRVSAATARMPVDLVTASFATGRTGAGEVTGGEVWDDGRSGIRAGSMPSLVLLASPAVCMPAGGVASGIRPSGGLGRPGAESRSTTNAGLALSAASGADSAPGGSASVESARGRRSASSSRNVVVVVESAVCAISSSSARTLVASSNASSGNSSASEWNGIGRGSGVPSVLSPNESGRLRLGPPDWLASFPSNASCTGAGATRVGVSVNIGGLVESAAGRCGACFAFSERILSSTPWLPSARRSNRTPIPGAIAGRLGSFSRVHTTVPSPAISGDASFSWNSKRICVPTASGSLVRMKMPPWLTSTA